MPKLEEKSITTLSEYMGHIEAQKKVKWYRGVGDSTYTLTPSLFRHPTIVDAIGFFAQEYEILKRFKQRSVPYLESRLENADDLYVLFIMQHYGVPTRLLDWTENPYIGLFFALSSAKFDGPRCVADATVWELDPEIWNDKALDFDNPGIISPPSDELLNGYKPGYDLRFKKRERVALHGVYNSPRIVAQRGAFTLFGIGTDPMENTYVKNGYPDNCLVKLVIKRDHVKDMFDSLIKIGITDSVVYPDLPGLAKEIRRSYGYNI